MVGSMFADRDHCTEIYTSQIVYQSIGHPFKIPYLTMSRAAIALALVALMAAATTSDALAVRQVFVWGLGNGVGGAAGAKAVRIALYNGWNKVNKNSVSGYWIGQQNDGLLFGAKDDTWGEIGGYTDWSTVEVYKSFKVWEKNQPTYKNLPVTSRRRLVSYL